MNRNNTNTAPPPKPAWLTERGRPATPEQIFREAQSIPGRGPGRFVAAGSDVDSWKRKFRGRR